MRPPYRNRIAVTITALAVMAGGEAWAQAIPDPEDPLGEVDALGDYDLLVDLDDPLRGTVGEELDIGDINALQNPPDDDPDGEPADDTARNQRTTRVPLRDAQVARPPDARDPAVRDDTGEVAAFVRERARPELDPLGLRAGSFVISPEVETAVEVTDNIFSTAANRRADVLFVARPTLRVQSDWGRHELVLGYSGEYGVYAENSSENPEATTLTAAGRLDVTRRTALAANGSFTMDQEGRGDAETATAAIEPTSRLRYTGGAEASHRFNRLTASLRGGIDVEDYEDGVDSTGALVDNSDRDRTTLTGGGRLAYEISPKTNVFVDGEYVGHDYDRAVDNAGFNRDSDGATVRVGGEFTPTPLTRIRAGIGFHHEDMDDPALETLNEVIGDIAVAWAMTPLTTVNASFTNEVDTTTIAGASGSVSRTVAAGFDHELLRHVIISAGGSYEWLEYRGVPLSEETVTASLSAEYRLNRAAALTAGYEHETTMTAGAADVSENRFLVGLTVRR